MNWNWKKAKAWGIKMLWSLAGLAGSFYLLLAIKALYCEAISPQAKWNPESLCFDAKLACSSLCKAQNSTIAFYGCGACCDCKELRIDSCDWLREKYGGEK